MRFDLGPLSIRWAHKAPELTVYLVRHGESQTNADHSLHFEIADPEVELTSLGFEQAYDAGERLVEVMSERGDLRKRFRVYHSDYRRAHQTAECVIRQLEIIGRRRGKFDVRMDDRIRELEFGLLNGMKPKDIAEQHELYDAYQKMLRGQDCRYYIRRFGGESPADVADRCRNFINAMYRDYDRHGIKTFVVVAHGLTNRVMAKLLLKKDRVWYQSQNNPHNGAIRLIVGKTDHGYVHGDVEDWETTDGETDAPK